jgi:F5/8 type C domain
MGFTGPGVTLPPFSIKRNLAEGKHVTASSFRSSCLPENAADGKIITRWASSSAGESWIKCDLNGNYRLDQIRILWHDNYALRYNVLLSADNEKWYLLHSELNGDGGVDEFNPGQGIFARYVKIHCFESSSITEYSIRELEIFGNDLADNKTVTASSFQNNDFIPECVNDGQMTSRWSSEFSDPQWISIDLGETYTINHLRILWENAYADSYSVQISMNGTDWNSVYSTTSADGRIDDIVINPVDTRYVRIYCTKRATVAGYSIWELELFPAESRYPGNNSWIIH